MLADVVILDYGNVEVRNSDFESLRAEGWLTGEIINFYLTYLELSEFNEKNSVVVFLGTYTAYRITNTKSITTVDNISTQLSTDLHSKEVIMIPLNHRNHWSLLVFCKITKTFYHYDSISKYNRDFAERAVKRLTRALDPEAAKSAQSRYFFKSMQTPQQNNDHDCGIYVLAIAEELARRYINHRPSIIRSSSASSSTRTTPVLSTASSSASSSQRSSGFSTKSNSDTSGYSYKQQQHSNPFSNNSFFNKMSDITGPSFCSYSSPLSAFPYSNDYNDTASSHLQTAHYDTESTRSEDLGVDEGSDNDLIADFPRNFWRVTEEDIEYPVNMRQRMRRLILELQRRKLYG
ncbi:SUMO1 sentrin specific peptidase 8 [Mycoemilia scoparia]|uniref:SUMO1 sentrin specific peptidase 8 n=1 Tax=Mycoemilia scoparia TaxID=417184 RepID=A0A9W8A827_9FUNG|nr:SUMO1 sentrin specific peptidase 8 [Mycoemilia scoparia]